MNSKNSRLINSLRKLLLGNNIQIEMEQTKAVFRNKPFILLKGIILLLIFILTTSLVRAQYSLGSTGQLMIPTAEMQGTGTFIGGANYLPEQVTPSVFSFPTMNYFVDMTLFSFIEFTYRMTLLKMTTATGRTGYHNQDRSNTIRIRPLKESRYFPAVVIGGDDLLTEGKLHIGVPTMVCLLKQSDSVRDINWQLRRVGIFIRVISLYIIKDLSAEFVILPLFVGN